MYEYDLLDRVTKVIDRNGEVTVYEYDEVGNRTAVKYANGVTMSYTYDPCHRLKEEWVTDGEGNTVSKYVYTLGRAGERIAIEETDVLGNETTISYTYDKLERLTEEKIQSGDNQLVNSYAYDKASNRLSKETTVTGDVSVLADEQLDEVEIVEGKTAYTYNALNQLLSETSSEGEINYTYDEKGSLIKQTGDQTIDYSYDMEGHLFRATVQKGNKVTIESYTYDYAGNRTSKTEGDKATTYYVVDTNGSLTQVTAETDSEGREKAYYTRGEELISMERNSQLWNYTYDGHGNVRTLTNEYGNIPPVDFVKEN